MDLPQRHQRHLWRWAFLNVRWPCSFWLILWVFDGLVTQCSQKSSCCGHFYHCFYLQGVGWAQRKTQGAAQRQTLLTLPSRLQIELSLLLSQDPPTPPAGLHSSQGRRALLLSPIPPSSSLPHQLLTPPAPYPIRWEKQKSSFFPQDVFTWKGCLAGWWAMELVCQSHEEADLSFTFLWEVPEWKAESDQFQIGTVTRHTRLTLSEK